MKRKHQLRHHALKRVIESSPTIENTTTQYQAVEKHRRRSNKAPSPNTVRPTQTSRCCGLETSRLQFGVSDLRLKPATQRLAIVMEYLGQKRLHLSLKAESLRMSHLIVRRAVPAI